MASRQKVSKSRGGEFVHLSKVIMTLKSYLAVGILNMLLASYAASAVQDLRVKRSEEDNQNDLGIDEVEGSGTDTESTNEGKLSC